MDTMRGCFEFTTGPHKLSNSAVHSGAEGGQGLHDSRQIPPGDELPSIQHFEQQLCGGDKLSHRSHYLWCSYQSHFSAGSENRRIIYLLGLIITTNHVPTNPSCKCWRKTPGYRGGTVMDSCFMSAESVWFVVVVVERR